MLLVLTACTSAAVGSLPSSSAADIMRSSRLQFAIGTATYTTSPNGTPLRSVGLNFVETLRQANGLSAILDDLPVITGPTTFNAGSCYGYGAVCYDADLNTNRITSASLGSQTGAFGYGFCACNSVSATQVAPTLGSSAATPAPATVGAAEVYVALSQPMLLSGTGSGSWTFYGGPPAFPAYYDGGYPSNFQGFSEGFATAASPPVVGSYRLDIGIPPNFTVATDTSSPTLSATAALKDVSGLPVMPTPVFTSDGNGGGTFALNVPLGVTETMIDVAVQSVCLGAAYTTPSGAATGTNGVSYNVTIVSTAPAGVQTISLPDNLGPLVNGQATPTMCSQKATYTAQAIGFDYPAYEASYPNNLSQTPTITGANGQADLTISAVAKGTYP